MSPEEAAEIRAEEAERTARYSFYPCGCATDPARVHAVVLVCSTHAELVDEYDWNDRQLVAALEGSGCGDRDCCG